MTPQETIDSLKYLISEDCTDNQFDYINEIGVAIEAIEKQIPKKPLDVHTPVVTWGLCPVCKGELNKLGGRPNRLFLGTAYCPDCGQALDWSDKNDD